MKIGKEKEVETKIHKKQDSKIHKKKDVKIDNKAMSTRTKNNARAMRKVVESKITDSIEGGENIEETFEATGMAMKPLKSIAKEGNRIRKKAKVSKLQKEVIGSRVRNKMTFMIKKVVSLLAPLITPILIIVIAATGIVFAVIAVLYNSPFALFLPPLESGDTIQSVTTQYVSEFNQEVQTLIDEHKDADKGRGFICFVKSRISLQSAIKKQRKSI